MLCGTNCLINQRLIVNALKALTGIFFLIFSLKHTMLENVGTQNTEKRDQMAEEPDSYSLEAEANMEVCLENLIENLKSVGSADAYKNALFGIKLMVEKKQRRLSDLSSIGPGPVPRSLELMVFSRDLIPQIVKEIK